MSSLHEQYETLRRRGMPEHPRLRRKQGVWILNDTNSHSPAVRLSDALYPDDARHLITMHAIKWVESMGDGRAAVFHREGGKWSLTLHHDDTHCSVTVPPLLGLVALDAIIAATGHLEATP